MAMIHKEFDAMFNEVKNFQKQHETFIRQFLLEMGMRALRKTKPRTPVDTGTFVIIDSKSIDVNNPKELLSFIVFEWPIFPIEVILKDGSSQITLWGQTIFIFISLLLVLEKFDEALPILKLILKKTFLKSSLNDWSNSTDEYDRFFEMEKIPSSSIIVSEARVSFCNFSGI